MPQAKQSHYAAFISYRHSARDRVWATRIFEALETYRIPRSLRREGYPDRVGKVFRDEDEIPASADLNDQIVQALARSDVLIVVCSPETPKSRWIRREITLFQEMGKGHRIIPLLIEGEPEQSFPPELLRRTFERTRPDGTTEQIVQDVEPVAADVRARKGEKPAKTFERAVLRLAAASLGITFDDLYQRDRQRRAATRRRIGAAVFAGAVAASGASAWIWDSQFRTKTQHCANYGERWGVPFCVGELSEAEAMTAFRHWRITTRAGRPVELARLNGSMTALEAPENLVEGEDWNSGTARFVYAYRAEGDLAAVDHVSETGRAVRRVGYTFAADRRTGIARFESDLGIAERQVASGSALGVVGSRGSSNDFAKRTAIGQHRLTFDGAGNLLERKFEPVGGGAKASDAQGAYGRAYRLNALGLMESVRNLDAVGDTLVEKSGVAGQRRSYDARGWLTSVEWHTKEARPTANTQAYAVVRYVRESAGRPSRYEFFDAEGRPTTRNDTGAHRYENTFDARGNIVAQSSFGVGDTRIVRKDLGVHSLKCAVDARGFDRECAYFDVEGRPSPRKDTGAAVVIYSRDGRGLTTEQRSFDAERRLVLTKNLGSAIVRWRYDAEGRETHLGNFGVDDRPITTKDGYSSLTKRYDLRGNLLEEAYFGRDGAPILLRDRGFARLTFAYDEQGNAIEEAYFGTDGKPILHKTTGAARVAYRFDARGNRVEHRFFGATGAPTLRTDIGAARLTVRYDERGNSVEETYYGTDDRPILRKDLAFSVFRQQFDTRGQMIDERYFGTDLQPTLRKDWGVHRIATTCDERGNATEHRYFSTDGRPTLRKDMLVSTWRMRYDERGNEIERAAYDTDDRPTIARNIGAARQVSTFDTRGNLIRIAYTDADGKPMRSRAFGFAGMTIAVDDLGNDVELRSFGLDERLMSEIKKTYDGRGRLIRESVFKDDGRPGLNEKGISTRRLRYDDSGHTIEQATYGIDDRPAAQTDNDIARTSFTYDDRGREIEAMYFGTDSLPVAHKTLGYAIQRSAYDDAGNLIERTYYDTTGRPAYCLKCGSAVTRWTFDAVGRNIAEAHFGPDGAPIVNRVTGFARNSLTYDARGNVVESAYFDATGAPMMNTDLSAARTESEYDELGRLATRRAFSERGTPAWTLRQRFDDRSELVESVTTGGDGKIMDLRLPSIVEQIKAVLDGSDHREKMRLFTLWVAETDRVERAVEGAAGRRTAEALGNFTWYALMAKDPAAAVAAADRALVLAPDLTWIATNKAHALMFLGRADEALALHRKFKGAKVFANKDATWDSEIISDFAKLREAGLAHSQMIEIERLFAEPMSDNR